MQGNAVKFELVLEAVLGLPKSTALFFVTYSMSSRLGSKKVAGETKKVLLGADGSASLNQDVALDVQLHQKGNKTESCLLKVSVKEEGAKNKKAKTISSVELDLSEFASFREFETKVFNLLGTKQKPPPSLRFRVRALPGGKAADSAPPSATPSRAASTTPITQLGDDDSASDDRSRSANPFGEAPSGYAGNALFKRMGGDYDAPDKLDATHTLLEQAKAAPVIPKMDTYTGNALFKRGEDDFKTPSRVPVSTTMQVLEDSKKSDSNPFAAVEKKDANPFGAAEKKLPPPAAADVVSPPTVGSPYGFSSPAPAVLSPSSEELQMLRKQNKMLQQTLEKQEEKIDQLRNKMRHGRGSGAAKSGSPPSPSLGGEAFLREKERAIADLTTRLNEAESRAAEQKERAEKLAKSADSERERAARLTASAEEMSSGLQAEKRRNEDLASKLELERKRAAAAEATVAAKGGAEAKARLTELDDLRGKLAAVTRDADSERRRTEELSAKLASQNVQLEAEKKRAAAAEAALASKGGADAKARQAETTELRAELDRVTKALEAERVRVRASDKQVEELKQKLVSATIQVEAEKKRAAAATEAAQRGGDKSAKLVEAEKQIEEYQAKLAAVNRELSGQQLAVIDLSNRLRDAEAPRSDSKGGTPDGEVSSLQMQLVAMEQDYESQLDELRNELEEAHLAAGGTGSGGAVGGSSDGGEERSARRMGSFRVAGGPSAEHERTIEQLQARVAELESRNLDLQVAPSPMRGMGSLNPLMETPAASPFSSDEFEKLTSSLHVMQAVNDCVWTAKMVFDELGVAMACGSILRHINEDEDAAATFDKMAAAIETAAVGQLCTAGRMYWLNAVTNLLESLSKSMPGSGILSPKNSGVQIVGSAAVVPTLHRQTSSVRKELVVQFVPKLLQVCFAIYRAILEDVRGRILGPALAKGVFEPAQNARAALGARHNAGATESVIAELDALLRDATQSFVFPVVVKQLFGQIFYDIGAHLFNAMMKRHDLSASRAIAIKLEVSAFDNWPATDSTTSQNKDLLRNVSEGGLGRVKEVCNLLFIDKATFLQRSAVAEMCPHLNARQVKSFLSAFVPDDICPDKTPLEVLDRLSADIKKTDALKIDENHWLSAVK